MHTLHFAVNRYNNYKHLLESETEFNWKRRKFRKESLIYWGEILIANNLLSPTQLKQDGKRNK